MFSSVFKRRSLYQGFISDHPSSSTNNGTSDDSIFVPPKAGENQGSIAIEHLMDYGWMSFLYPVILVLNILILKLTIRRWNVNQ